MPNEYEKHELTDEDQAADGAPATIYSRFINARKAFGKATKNARNSRSTYADLSSVLDAVDTALNDNGLFIHQVVNEQTLHTMIVDEEGNTLDFGHMPILASKNDAQGYSSDLTYARRYSIMAAFGIVPEDDDIVKAVESAPHMLQEVRQALIEWEKRKGFSLDIARSLASVDQSDSVETWRLA